MEQIHRRFTAEQVKVLLRGYCQGILDRPAIEETLRISKSRFFVLLWERASVVSGNWRPDMQRKLTDEQAHRLCETLLKLNCLITIKNHTILYQWQATPCKC